MLYPPPAHHLHRHSHPHTSRPPHSSSSSSSSCTSQSWRNTDWFSPLKLSSTPCTQVFRWRMAAHFCIFVRKDTPYGLRQWRLRSKNKHAVFGYHLAKDLSDRVSEVSRMGGLTIVNWDSGFLYDKFWPNFSDFFSPEPLVLNLLGPIATHAWERKTSLWRFSITQRQCKSKDSWCRRSRSNQRVALARLTWRQKCMKWLGLRSEPFELLDKGKEIHPDWIVG